MLKNKQNVSAVLLPVFILFVCKRVKTFGIFKAVNPLKSRDPICYCSFCALNGGFNLLAHFYYKKFNPSVFPKKTFKKRSLL